PGAVREDHGQREVGARALGRQGQGDAGGERDLRRRARAGPEGDRSAGTPSFGAAVVPGLTSFPGRLACGSGCWKRRTRVLLRAAAYLSASSPRAARRTPSSTSA